MDEIDVSFAVSRVGECRIPTPLKGIRYISDEEQVLSENLSGVPHLTGADRVDPRAVVVLVARRRVLYASHGDLAVAASRPEMRQVLKAAAGGELPVFASVGEALQWVRGGAAATTARAGMRLARMAGR